MLRIFNSRVLFNRVLRYCRKHQIERLEFDFAKRTVKRIVDKWNFDYGVKLILNFRFFFFCSAANTTKKTIFILGLFALTDGVSEKTAGLSEVAAASLAIEHINQMQILGCEYELKMLVNNTQVNSLLIY